MGKPMFLLRSAFWLILAFMIIRPEVDMGETATNLSGEAMARGSSFIAQQIDAIECDTLQCHGGKAVAVAVAAINTPALAGDPMHAIPALPAVPLPRPRPDRQV